MKPSRVSTSVSVPIVDMSRSAELLIWTSTHLYPLIAEAVAYGVYCVLFILCMVKLIRSGHTREWNGLRSLIFITAILMFCVGTTHFILVLQQGSSSIDVVRGSIHTRASRDWYEHTKSSLEVANVTQAFTRIHVMFLMGRLTVPHG
ncbi:hypothetical protein PENSPDRAFT_124868 [Peniophora sp. CONT]|nr:hypothetical protein PENSPDRAFT_124868 [Peniophora sp. CONT]